MIVSHDRYFMDRLVEHLFVFEGLGMVRDFPGNYSDYRIWQRVQDKQGTELTAADPEPVVEPAAENTVQKAKRKLSFNEKREFEQLEKDMPALEKRT